MKNEKQKTPERASFVLACNERQEANDAGALDFLREFTLVTSANAVTLASNDLSKRGNEAAQNVSIFVVDRNFLVNTEEAVTTFSALKHKRLEIKRECLRA